MQTVMPLFFKVMNFEKTIGPEQRYAIDWDERLSLSRLHRVETLRIG